MMTTNNGSMNPSLYSESTAKKQVQKRTADKEKASESGETLALGGSARKTKSNVSKFNTLAPRLERMIRMLLSAPNGLSVKELLPIGTTHTPNQTKELRDCYGFELPMERIYFDSKNRSRFYGRFSLSVSDRVKALQLLGGAV